MNSTIASNLSGPGSSTAFKKQKDSLKIGVIAGGISSERDISLLTGEGIYRALIDKGYKASFIDFNGDISIITGSNIDIAFVALHGKFGEDGTVQGLLELMKIPYTGSGVLASALAMDKIYTKKIFAAENIPTPPYLALYQEKSLNYNQIIDYVQNNIKYPVIVKPNRGGSTIGVTIIDSSKNLQDAVKTALRYDSSILIEKFIQGRLLTVGIIGLQPRPLPLIEIKPKSGFYDYAAKYTSGLTEYIIPAPLNKKLEESISAYSLKCHEILGCSALSRVDLIMDNNKNIYFLEVNTMPGMTSTSLVPKAAAACGIDFNELTEIILNCASLKL
ncbi:MAG: D-alanine--D-alanine ligase [Actinobacteria bacterium]|nr:D-alanine--D-alanine ligase [Actinomycetota bacterium]